jgi:hypothetical protein
MFSLQAKVEPCRCFDVRISSASLSASKSGMKQNLKSGDLDQIKTRSERRGLGDRFAFVSLLITAASGAMHLAPRARKGTDRHGKTQADFAMLSLAPREYSMITLFV